MHVKATYQVNHTKKNFNIVISKEFQTARIERIIKKIMTSYI